MRKFGAWNHIKRLLRKAIKFQRLGIVNNLQLFVCLNTISNGCLLYIHIICYVLQKDNAFSFATKTGEINFFNIFHVFYGIWIHIENLKCALWILFWSWRPLFYQLLEHAQYLKLTLRMKKKQHTTISLLLYLW